MQVLKEKTTFSKDKKFTFNVRKSNDNHSEKRSQDKKSELSTFIVPDLSKSKTITKNVNKILKNKKFQVSFKKENHNCEEASKLNRISSNIRNTKIYENEVTEQSKDFCILTNTFTNKYSTLDEILKIQLDEVKENQGLISEELNDFYNQIVDLKKCEENIVFKNSNYDQKIKISSKNFEDFVDEIKQIKNTNETMKNIYECNIKMLTGEIKNNEAKIKSQSESINLLKSKIFEISNDLLNYKEENEKLKQINEDIKEENEKLRISLQNSSQTVNKAQEVIQELRGQATEYEIEIGILNSQIKKSNQSQPSAGKDINIFTRDLKMFIFSMLENCHNYNDINNTLKKSINHFLNREIDDDISRRLLCKWKEEFNMCSVYVSGYMLEEFIRKKGKGVLVQRKIALKNKKLQTFVLCGNAEGRFYEILLGAIEVKNYSGEYMVKCFEELLETLADVTNNLKEDFILDIYNAIYGYMNDNTRSGKKINNLFNEKVYFGKDPNDIRKYITYSSISYIGINILKTIEKLIYNLTEGKKIFVFLRNISKELCQENCNYYPSANAFNNFIKNKLIREKNEGKIAIKPKSKISSIEGSSTQMYGMICQDIIYSYSDLIEFSKINENRFDICKKILSMLSSKEVMNLLIFIAYINEMFVYPIMRAASSTDIKEFVSYIKNIINEVEVYEFSKLPDIQKMILKYGNNYTFFKYGTLSILSNMMKKTFEDDTIGKEIIVKVLKETVKNVKKKFINVYERINEDDDQTGRFVKIQTKIIANNVFSQVKQNSSKILYKDITMISSQVRASFNKMTEVLEQMTQSKVDSMLELRLPFEECLNK